MRTPLVIAASLALLVVACGAPVVPASRQGVMPSERSMDQLGTPAAWPSFALPVGTNRPTDQARIIPATHRSHHRPSLPADPAVPEE